MIKGMNALIFITAFIAFLLVTLLRMTVDGVSLLLAILMVFAVISEFIRDRVEYEAGVKHMEKMEKLRISGYNERIFKDNTNKSADIQEEKFNV